MAACPAEETLLQFAEGRLGAERAEPVLLHLDACAACMAVVTEVARDLTVEPGPVAGTATSPGEPPSPEDAALFSPPDRLDEYQIIHPIGRGGMGEVFVARDLLLDRKVAIKFIARTMPSEALRERFRNEARAIARVSHPNVVAIHRVGYFSGRPYLVSEYVPGVSLDKLERPQPEQEVLRIGIALSRGLAAVHRRGILHRDIKLANTILATDGEVKLLDFGLAKLIDPSPRAIPPSARVAARFDPFENLGLARTVGPAGAGPDPSPTAPAAGGASELTDPGALIGTPSYMPPEAWRGEPATVRGDLYSLGVLLHALAAGNLPHGGPPWGDLRARVCDSDSPPLSEVAPGIDPALAAIVDRCLRRNPEERFATAEELASALEGIRRPSRSVDAPEGPPYRGLLSFEAQQRAFFFGRAGEVREVVERVLSEPFVLVAGDSGVGKSSLCRAGVLPALAEERSGPRLPWSQIELVPGRRPLQALAAALARALGADEPTLAADLARDPGAGARAVRALKGHQTVVFVDQMEELVTLSEPGEAALAAEALAAFAIPAPNVRLLGTARGDFLTRLASLLGLHHELPRALFLPRALSDEDLREAIVGPARLKGYHFESESLVQSLVGSTAGLEGGLPLLQFALGQLWDLRDEVRRVIPDAALAKLGGVAGALARHADGVLSRLLPVQRAAAKELLSDLVTAEGTRARRTEGELLATRDPAARAALEALVAGRLVVAQADEHGASSYEIAHEVLLQGWETLRGWLNHDAERRGARQRLERAAAEWTRLARSQEALWGARQLDEVAILSGVPLPQGEQQFLQASRRAVSRRRRRVLTGAAAIPILALLFYGGFRLAGWREIDRSIRIHVAEAASAIAEARREQVDPLRTEAFGLFDAHEPARAEDRWEQARQAAAREDDAFARAGRALEAALVLDGARRDLRAQFADVLFTRMRIAEREHRLGPAELSEAFARLALYDDHEERRRIWNAPARLRIEPRPAGAQVVVERFAEGPKEKGHFAPVRTIAHAADAETLELAPGSYRLTLSASGRATVRQPLLARRGEQRTVPIDLPLESAVPAGFVYVAPGRYLLGSSQDGAFRRKFLSAVPQHEAEGAGFLIAARPTTFAEWIEFLRAIPPRERAVRWPRYGTPGQPESLSLEERAGGDLTLRFEPTDRALAPAGRGRLRYPARDRNAVQEWGRMPVVGISYADAEAYARWLSATGRIPRARLCRSEEWEHAARGADGRLYPHGNRLDADDANFDETYGMRRERYGPDEVGSRPASSSPFGVDDMAGNVFQWVASTDRDDGMLRMRGGSYNFDDLPARADYSERAEAGYRQLFIGVRLCADPAP